MAWLALTKKSQAREIALKELRHLLAILQIKEDLSENFWEHPYPVGFVQGYTTAVTVFVAGANTTADLSSRVLLDVFTALAPQETAAIAQRLTNWSQQHEPRFEEAFENGGILAMFLLGNKKSESTPLAREAFRKARERASLFDQLQAKTDERGRAAIVLREMLFYDQFPESP